MPLYTRRGDAGDTGLMGARVAKDHARVEALGAVDELNAAIGVVLAHVEDATLQPLLHDVQNVLFTVGAELSAAGGEAPRSRLPRVAAEHVAALETAIASLEGAPLKAFVLPRGSVGVAHLHLARAIARRVERRTVALSRLAEEAVNPELLRYLNRLSSLLFAMALWLDRKEGRQPEHPRYGGEGD